MTGLVQEKEFSRRSFVKGGGALLVGFTLAGGGLAKTASAASAGAATGAPVGGPWPAVNSNSLDSWIKVASDGSVTMFGSSMDSGQGTPTAFSQIIADELDVPFDAVKLLVADTAVSPNNGSVGAATGVIYNSQPLRYAAAEARLALLRLASAQFGVPIAQLSASDGVITVTANPSQKVTYGELIGGRLFNVNLTQVNLPGVPVRSGGVAFVANDNVQLKDPSQYKVIGTSVPRLDIPGKISGSFTYVQNIRLPGMVHARLVLPPGPGYNLVSVDGFRGKPPASYLSTFTKGNLVAVVAEKEYDAIEAASTLQVKWSLPTTDLPGNGNLNNSLRTSPHAIPDQFLTRPPRALGQSNNANRGNVAAGLQSAAKVVAAEYYFPVHAHGMLAPWCGVADVNGGNAVIYCATQGVNGTQSTVASTLGFPLNNVRVIWYQGAGTYGRPEDAAAAAALISQAVGKPVRLQFMRWDDFLSDSFGVPYSYTMSGGLDTNGNITAFTMEAWTTAVNPSTEGPTLATILTGQAPTGPSSSQTVQSFSGGDINAYEFANESWVVHQVAPFLRYASGSLRSPKRIQNNFAHESFMDELAAAANMDPIEFRIQQIQNTQALIPTIEPGFDPTHYERQLATLLGLKEMMNWETRPSPGPGATSKAKIVTGRGISSMGNYTNTFGSMGAEVQVNMQTGKITATKLWNYVDPGLVINPRGAKNTVAQGVIFALSRTLHEELKFGKTQILSRDWITYPILRFLDVPEQEVQVVSNPQYWGGGIGEGNEIQVSAAIGNAFFDATGVRLREVPFTPAKVKAAFKAAGKA